MINKDKMSKRFSGKKISYQDFLCQFPDENVNAVNAVKVDVDTRGIRAKLNALNLSERSNQNRKKLVNTKKNEQIGTKAYNCAEFSKDFPSIESKSLSESNVKSKGVWENDREHTINIMKHEAKVESVNEDVEDVEEDDVSDIDSHDEREAENLLDAMREDDEWDDI